MLAKPGHISDERWDSLSDEEKTVEHEACRLLDSREFISHDTRLIQACLNHNVMSIGEIVGYPQYQRWSTEECKRWCQQQGNDLYAEIDGYDRAALEVWLADVIQFGVEEISTDILRTILRRRLDDEGEQGLSLWRQVVQTDAPNIYEWWGIEVELADDMLDIGQYVLKNEYGQWWGRCCTGQNILMDGTIQAIVKKRQQAASKQPVVPCSKKDVITATAATNQLYLPLAQYTEQLHYALEDPDQNDFDYRLSYLGHLATCARIFMIIQLQKPADELRAIHHIESMSYEAASRPGQSGVEVKQAWLRFAKILQQYIECSE